MAAQQTQYALYGNCYAGRELTDYSWKSQLFTIKGNIIMSIRLKASQLATAVLMAAPAVSSTAFAQAISSPSNDQTQTANTAAQKAQNSTIDQPANHLPTNPRTITEQPDQPAPAAPHAMSNTSKQGKTEYKSHLKRTKQSHLTVKTKPDTAQPN